MLSGGLGPPLGGDLRDRAGAVGNDGRLGKQAPDARRRASVALRSRNVNLVDCVYFA